MAVTLALLTVGVCVVRAQRRAARLDGAGSALSWPCVIAEVEARIRRGGPGLDREARDLAEVTFGVLLHGPPRTRAAAHAAIRALGPTAPAAALLGVASQRLASTRSDRLHDLVAAVGRTGTPPHQLLSRLRHGEMGDVAHHDAWTATERVGRAGRWLLLSPLVPVAAGVIRGPAAVTVAVAAVGLWAVAGAWIAGAAPPRPSRHALHVDGEPTDPTTD